MFNDADCQAVLDKMHRNNASENPRSTEEVYQEYWPKAREDRRYLIQFISQRSPFGPAPDPITPSEFKDAVRNTNFLDGESTQLLLRAMGGNPRPWIPLGQDDTRSPGHGYKVILYRLFPGACGLRPSADGIGRPSEAENEHEARIIQGLASTGTTLLGRNFLGVNFSIDPTIHTTPFRPTTSRSAKSTSLATAASNLDGFVFHQLGTIQYCYREELIENMKWERQEAYWMDGHYNVVAELNPRTGVVGPIWAIYNPRYEDQHGSEIKRVDGRAFGKLFGREDKAPVCCGKIGDGLDQFDHGVELTGFDRPFEFSQVIGPPVEIVRAVRVGNTELRRITVARKEEIIPNIKKTRPWAPI